MLVDLKVNSSKDIKPNSVLITDDGKTFYPVPLEKLVADILKEINDINLKLGNNERRIETIEQDVSGRIRQFVAGFVGGVKE